MLSLQELFESITVQGKISLCVINEDQECVGKCSAETDGGCLPCAFADYADCFVRYIYPQSDAIIVEVDAPADTEIFYTGGGIYCAVHKLPDGTWFTGATNEFGGVYATRKAAMDSFGDGDDFVRYVEDLEEQKTIWRDIYQHEIERDGDFDVECQEWLRTLDADLESMWVG